MRLLFCGLMLLAALPLHAQRGELVLQQNLADLAAEAATIIRGRVVSLESEPHPQFPNLHTLVVTLNVLEVLKGEAREQFTFRQYLPDLRDQYTRLGYKLGQEVFLLMIRPSQYGLSSPAGLEQGRFHILRDPRGNRLAVNGFNNLGLFRHLDRSAPNLGRHLSSQVRALLAQHRGGPIPHEQLVDLIRGLIAAHRELNPGGQP